jgi:hypothetical protein
VTGVTSTPPAVAERARQVEVSGIVLPVGVPGSAITRHEGQAFVASRALTQALLPGSDLTGFVGLAEATETVRRFWQGEEARYTMTGTQVLRGCLYVDGEAIGGGETFTQRIDGQGPLTLAETIDNPGTHAAAIDGTWTMTASGTGRQKLLEGHGTITWTGDPNVPLAYHGTVTYQPE